MHKQKAIEGGGTQLHQVLNISGFGVIAFLVNLFYNNLLYESATRL